jgi:hypothetical protein
VATVGIVLIINVHNNTKPKWKEVQENDNDILTIPYSSLGSGGTGGGQTISLADLLRMQAYAQATKDKDVTKTSASGGQYI